jgi:hypothetical protein
VQRHLAKLKWREREKQKSYSKQHNYASSASLLPPRCAGVRAPPQSRLHAAAPTRRGAASSARACLRRASSRPTPCEVDSGRGTVRGRWILAWPDRFPDQPPLHARRGPREPLRRATARRGIAPQRWPRVSPAALLPGSLAAREDPTSALRHGMRYRGTRSAPGQGPREGHRRKERRGEIEKLRVGH